VRLGQSRRAVSYAKGIQGSLLGPGPSDNQTEQDLEATARQRSEGTALGGPSSGAAGQKGLRLRWFARGSRAETWALARSKQGAGLLGRRISDERLRFGEGWGVSREENIVIRGADVGIRAGGWGRCVT